MQNSIISYSINNAAHNRYNSSKQKQAETINSNLNQSEKTQENYSNINFTGNFLSKIFVKSKPEPLNTPVQANDFAQKMFSELKKMMPKQQRELQETLHNINSNCTGLKGIFLNMTIEQSIKLEEALKVPVKDMTSEQSTPLVELLKVPFKNMTPKQSEKSIKEISAFTTWNV